ncbi:hypothetical protein ABL78_1561 [Leptomonas seymouri]|uniref:Uncharacterized protein n=1 Tax=Leptomonas seymouri TaxID=5684 RepID=A0A0N1I224_LEPSE|nr:hypothetical protein ABL78_1561 [Leptomonas seymouri]|eukprot:KPI89332.1 hypothetical protein ABL78_1561 [Leptomonas seymouri]
MSSDRFGKSERASDGPGRRADPPQSYPAPHGTTYQGAPSSSSYTSMGARRGMESRGRGQGQRYGDGAPRSRGGLFSQGGEHRSYSASPRRGSHYSGGLPLAEDGPRTKLSSYVTPHDAVQAQPAQHGAAVVRSGSAATEGGSILFFSSVQKKGGAFTASERETYAQLRQSRAIPKSNQRGGRGGNVVGSGILTNNVARQFEALEKSRVAKELGAVGRAVAASKRSRFTLESDDEDYEDEEESDSEGDEDRQDGRWGAEAEKRAKKPRPDAPDAQDTSSVRKPSSR